MNNEFVVGILIEETWKAMLDLRWITVAAQGRDQFYVVLTLAQRFTCKTLLFESGRCWDRTSDLCCVQALKRVLACPTASGRYATLQVLYEMCRDDVSTAYAPVPARL